MRAEPSTTARTGAFTMATVALAGAPAAISAMTPERSHEYAYDGVLRLGRTVMPAAAVVDTAARHRLAVHGQVPSHSPPAAVGMAVGIREVLP
ncbi:hypothetical protein ABZ208_19375 [Streptomyces sp. NPDC006208]|uniref:hypothetical protein n=1 Tax=Streptomyces sp. NPDC006208 TaxID=3156734 RepID=UPI0033B3B0FE